MHLPQNGIYSNKFCILLPALIIGCISLGSSGRAYAGDVENVDVPAGNTGVLNAEMPAQNNLQVAAEVSNIDLSNKPQDIPTLDYLEQNNVEIMAPTPDSPQTSLSSAYTLTQVDEVGDNSVTKYEWNEETQSFEPVYYKLDLKQTEYGEGEKSKTVTLTAPPVKDVNITFHYDEPVVSTESGDYANSYSNTTKQIEETSPVSSASSHYQIIGGVGQDVDFSQSVLFENNKMDATINAGVPSDWDRLYVDILGGAYNNIDTIEKITGTFVNNSISAKFNASNLYQISAYVYGGALSNSGDIQDVAGVFENNTIDVVLDLNGMAPSPSSWSSNYAMVYINGVALSNSGDIQNVTGAFINNSAITTIKLGSSNNDRGSAISYGGAIYNNGSIFSINADFLNNSVGYGGAIYNSETIENIVGDFIANSV